MRHIAEKKKKEKTIEIYVLKEMLRSQLSIHLKSVVKRKSHL